MGNGGIRVGAVVALALVSFAACGGDPAEPDGAGGAGSGGTNSGGTGGGAATGKTCPKASGAGTQHDNWLIDADETWTAADSPHYVTQDTSIYGATLTLEECAVVILSEDVTITVGESVGDPAALIARGTVDGTDELPVLLTSESEDTYWMSLWVDATGTLDLEGAVLQRGGSVAGANDNGVIVSAAQDELPVRQNIRLVDSLISEAAGFGVNLGRYTGFSDDSAHLVIQDVGQEEPSGGVDTRYPLFVTTGGVATIPEGDYGDNYYGAIAVYGGDRYPADVSFHDRGVPYSFESDLYIAPDDETPITLTLDAGVRLEFHKGIDGSDARFRVTLGSTAAPVTVIAEGTAAAPIVFSSAEETPAAGDWVGIDWADGTPTGNVMSYVTVEYAGADSQHTGFGCGNSDTDALLAITSWRPDDAFIENSTFAHSLGDGIISGWDSPSTGPDLTGNNTFDDIAVNRCNVTQPFVSSVCPGADAEPDCYD